MYDTTLGELLEQNKQRYVRGDEAGYAPIALGRSAADVEGKKRRLIAARRAHK